MRAGGAGRKIIPMEQKKAKGTYRKERDKEVPKPSDKKPRAPAWLNKRAKQIFWHMTNRLSVLNMASASHTEILALLCSRMEEVERFDKLLNQSKDVDGKETNGYVYQTSNSFGDAILKPNPAVELRDKAMRHVHSLLCEFGLTPAAAQKVGKPKESKKKNDFEEF
jgi:P27 family predicted phage terminase small subunit